MRRLVLATGLVLAACSAPEAREAEATAFAQRVCAPEAPWRKLGVVTGLPEAVRAGDGVIAPAVVEREGVLHLWYTQKTGTNHVLMHATSADSGQSFAAPALVTGLGEGLNAYPSVRWADGAFRLLYGTGSIKQASSADGVVFTPTGGSVLGASFETGRFDALSVLYPSLVASDPESAPAVLFFSGYDGQRMRIGRAVEGADGRFAVDPPHPVIDLGAAADFDNAAVAQAHVQRISGAYWMWYGGYDTSVSNPGPYRIGSASSADGVVWKKHGVALALAETGTDAWSTRDPVVIASGASWTMFYVGLGDDGRYRLHRAVSDACVER